MERKEIVGIIRGMMPDLTDGPFDVLIQADCGGNHISTYVEEGTNCENMHRIFFEKFGGERIIIVKCPTGYLQSSLKSIQDK